MDKLSGDFNHGYTKALLDLQSKQIFALHDLKRHHKSCNSKMVEKWLKCCIINRAKMRENRSGFIRYVSQDKDFEWYEEKE